MINITADDFSIDEVLVKTRRPSMGSIVFFLGTARNVTKGNPVEKLEYEADQELAVKELEKIRDETIQKFDVTDVSIIHRVGTLKPGENIVVIAAGSAHRESAFNGCRYVIEELKKRAMIWKKEYLSDRSYWVGDHTNE